jgi:hypothetical protein
MIALFHSQGGFSFTAEKGLIPAIQDLSGGPWWHEITPEVLEALHRHIRRASVSPSAFDPEGFLKGEAL